jgi:hypothetical protein
MYGVSAGFANYFPIIALIGSVFLFVIASPILVYNARLGLIVGLISCLLILPYNVIYVKGVFEDGVFNWGVLLAILPTVLVLISIYLTTKPIILKHTVMAGIPSNKAIKLFLSGTPIFLFVLYLIFYGKNWL